MVHNPPAWLSWNVSQCLHSPRLTSPLSLSVCLDHSDFLSPCLPFPHCSFLSLALAEINRRYLTLMWEHNVSCSVKTTFVSATLLSARGNCAPLSCLEIFLPQTRKRGRWERGISCHAEMKRMCCSSMWHMRWPVRLIVPLADATSSTLFGSRWSLTSSFLVVWFVG